MKVSLKIFTVSTFAILLLPVFVFAQSPGIPNQFYGTVSFADGKSAPDGTLIEAKIDGQTVATCPVKDGKYGYSPILCFVTDPNDNRWQDGGEIIHFFINGLDTEETVNFEKGVSTKLDFSLPDVSTGEITGEIDSATTVIVVPETPTTIKVGDDLNVSLTSANSTNAVIEKVEKLGTDFFTGATAILAGKNLLNSYEISITGDDIEISVTMKYDDMGIDETTIAPYKFDGSSWVVIEPYWQDTTLNTITFTISSAATPYVVFGSPPASTPPADTGTTGGGGGGGTADTTAPSISDVNVDVGRTTATITWQTNESSISWITYGITTAYGKEIKTASYNTSHSSKIENLSPSTTYHYQVKSRDTSGNVGEYTDKTFTTLAVQIKGDVNDDGTVNKYDFALMMSDWGKTGLNILSDLNNDGKVDKYDFSLLMVNWGK